MTEITLITAGSLGTSPQHVSKQTLWCTHHLVTISLVTLSFDFLTALQTANKFWIECPLLPTGHSCLECWEGKKIQLTPRMRWWVHTLVTGQKWEAWASLVAQWLRIHLPMQGTRVRALVREDPTCCGATKPVRHNYWACALEPASHNYWACVPQLLKPVHLEPVLHNKRSHRNEKPTRRNEE